MAGILNDPTTAAKWFLDDKKKAEAEKSEEAYDEITQATISRENEEKK
jgi:hypothetical protein